MFYELKSEIKKDFPIFNRKIDGKEIVYLDNGATSQRPQIVIDAISNYYSNHNANVKRGSYVLAEESSDLYEMARKTLTTFIGAENPSEFIFTKNSTDSLNMIVFGWASQVLKQGDTVLISSAEHNSNVIPWTILSKRLGLNLEYVELDDEGCLDLHDLEKKLKSTNAAVVSVSHATNVLGSLYKVHEISKLTKKYGSVLIVDGSQAVSHLPVNVAELGCDFYAFSAHKMLGPFGMGALWGKMEHLEKMQPLSYGGGMIRDFNIENFDLKLSEIPIRFEAGTPDVAGAVAFAAAATYLSALGMENVHKSISALVEYTYTELSKIAGLHILGPKDIKNRIGLISFYIDGIHSHDISAVLASDGVAVRSGLHCANLVYSKKNVPSSTRVSFSVYNSKEDVDVLVKSINKAVQILK